MLELATPTFTWPEAVHPRTRGGVMGDGHHGWAVADFLHLVRNLLLLEESDDLVLFPMIPEGWIEDGRRVSVTDAPTRFGKVSASMKSDGVGASVEIDGRYHRTPGRLIVCFPREVSTLRIDGRNEDLRFTDRVELDPAVRTLEVTFA